MASDFPALAAKIKSQFPILQENTFQGTILNQVNKQLGVKVEYLLDIQDTPLPNTPPNEVPQRDEDQNEGVYQEKGGCGIQETITQRRTSAREVQGWGRSNSPRSEHGQGMQGRGRALPRKTGACPNNRIGFCSYCRQKHTAKANEESSLLLAMKNSMIQERVTACWSDLQWTVMSHHQHCLLADAMKRLHWGLLGEGRWI